jgi:post-segregation antitoxin (ccd killing protein)
VTVRVDDDTKRKIKRYGIQVSRVARAALQAVRRMKEILRKVDIKRTVEHIREDRESR